MSGADVRAATPADNAQLCALFKSTPMESDLVLSVERDPDYFALYRLQGPDHEVTVAEVGGEIAGTATSVARDGFLDGRRTRVGYAGDLRLSSKLRGGFFLGRTFADGFREHCERYGCEVMYTAIFASNELAIRALVRRSKRFPDKPVYRPWLDYDILNVMFTWRRKPRPSAFDVRPATDADLGAVAELLARDHAQRPFGYCFDEALLRERIATWPDFGVENFYLAFAGETLVGVAAPWDAHAVKRFRVLAYRGGMRWARRGFNLAARLGRFTPLPPPGDLLRYCYLTHVSVRDDDPAVFAALLDRIYADLHGKGYTFLTAYRGPHDPLAPAFERYRCIPFPAKLFTVSLPGTRYAEWDPGPGRPGFELAFA